MIRWLARVIAGTGASAKAARADALFDRGVALAGSGRFEDAIALMRQATALKPADAALQYALGNVLLRADRAGEAAEAYRAGLAIAPLHSGLQARLGTALLLLGRFEEALERLEPLREREPAQAQLWFDLGNVYRYQGRIGEALGAYRRALALAPSRADIHSHLLFTLNYSAEHDGATVSAEHLRYGERFAPPPHPPAPDPRWPRRLRIGYVSPDFRSHVVSCFIWPALARHDRERFEVYCYFVHPRGDEVTARLRALADHWLDCADLTDEALAEHIRADRVDILVDLAGHTADHRLPAFALKPAPVQASYLGYPNTTGLRQIDFRITDAWADPPGESDRQSAERLVRLPRSYFCFRPGPDIHEVGPLPAATDGMVTFGCFGNFSKLSGEFLDCAARVLLEVPNSRLLLKCRPLGEAAAAERTRARFAAAGIGRARLTLKGWEPKVEEHLGAYAGVDIALDSFPYNGATTTCEAMWMGVPVVTLAGDRHAGRMGASLLSAVGLDGLVARSVDEYVAICARLAGDLSELSTLRARLRDRMRRSPLRDEEGYTRALERCYLEMWQSRFAERGRDRTSVAARADEPSACYELGCARLARGEFVAAAESFRGALELDPGHARARCNLGCALEAQGATDDAVRCYRDALRADPGLAQAHYNLGNALRQRGSQREALASLQEAIRLEPEHAEWHCNLGDLLLGLRRADEAIERYRAALRIDPAQLRAREGLASAAKSSGVDAAALD